VSIKENLDKTIETKLFEEIIKGEWTPGSKIDLNRIIERYDVSRTPVIHALRKMHSEGLVEYSSKGHFYVPDYDLKTIRDVTSMRKLLELQGMRELKSYGMSIDFDLIREMNEQCEYHIDKGKLVEASVFDMRFHRYLIDAAGNKCLSDMFKIVQRQFMMINYSIRRYKASQQSAACLDHERIIDYLEEHNYDQAAKILEDHVSEAYLKIEKRFLEGKRDSIKN